jgi:hypothetical protein
MTRDLYVSVTDVGRYTPFRRYSIEELAALRTLAGYVIAPQNAWAGGYAQVKITDCVNLVCQTLSGGPQPVVQINHPVYWVWAISTEKPGPAMIVLDEKLYKGSTGKTLEQALPVAISLSVRATKGHKQHEPKPKPKPTPSWFDSVDHAILALGTLCVALAGIIGLLEVLFRPIRRTWEHYKKA